MDQLFAVLPIEIAKSGDLHRCPSEPTGDWLLAFLPSPVQIGYQGHVECTARHIILESLARDSNSFRLHER